MGALGALMALVWLAGPSWAPPANAPWGDNAQINLGIVAQSGTGVSAWNLPGRADLTSDAIRWATAQGDGTYQVRLDLTPGQTVNFIWFAKVVAAGGLMGYASGYQTAEPIPSSADDRGYLVTTSTTAPEANQVAGNTYYTSIGGDARRALVVPNVSAGTTVWVYSNFASTPTGVANLGANPGNGQVKLTWRAGAGWWAPGDAQALDTAGGSYRLYRSTVASSGPFSLVTTLTGVTTEYIDTGLTNGTTSYYIFASSDSYGGATNPAAYTAWANLARVAPPTATFNAAYDGQARPGSPVPVYFKVDGADWEYIQKHDYLVYMTPWNEDARLYTDKIPGRIIRVRLPKQG